MLALLLCLPALVPALMPGWFEGHDDLHIFRLIEFDAALRDGQIPPRWFPDVAAGYGSPHPTYYAPLFYLFAEAFHLVGLGVIGSLKAAVVIVTLLAGLSMFLYARRFLGEGAALIAAAAYTYAPYHLLDLYVRKAFSEATVFAFLPFLLSSLHDLKRRGGRADIVSATLAIAAMSTSHTITNMLVPPLVAAYALAISIEIDKGRIHVAWRWMIRVGVALVLGYALAGFFLIPAFLERNAINIGIFTGAYLEYGKHFVHPQQLIWWPWGFGMSLEGLEDKMSFRLGLLQIAGTLLAVTALGRLRKERSERSRLALFYLGLSALSIFLMLPASSPIWALVAPMKFVQFPWRFLTLTTLSTAFLCGCAFALFGPGPGTGTAAAARRRYRTAVYIGCSAFAGLAAAGGMLSVHMRIPEGRVGFEEKPYPNMIDLGEAADPEARRLDREAVRRHTLRWLDHLPAGVDFMGLDASDLARPRVEVAGGEARVEVREALSWRIRFEVQAATPARIRVNVYRFPGWTVRSGGREVPLVEPPRNRRVIIFDLARGAHDVTVVYRRTPPRRLGDGLTLASLAVLAILGLWPGRWLR